MTNLEEHTNDEVLIMKILAGEADTSDTSFFHKKYDADKIFRSLYFKMKEMWESSQGLIMVQNIDVEKAIANFMERIDNAEVKSKKSHTFVLRAIGIAAAITVAFILGVKFWGDSDTKIFTTTNIVNILLPDSSEVTINKNSELTYPKSFSGHTRSVYLTGEAYFKIKKNTNQPFVITANDANIKVLGTSFNVNSAGNNVTVSVNSGVVLLYPKNEESKHITLKVGETGRLSLTNHDLSKQPNSDLNFNSWATGILTFNQTKLSDALQLLSEYYHKKITVQDKNLGNCKLTAVFNNKSLDSVLAILEITFDIKAVKQDSVILKGNGCIK